MPKGIYKRQPRALDEEVIEKLVEAFNAGATNRIACGHAGVSVPSLWRWLQRGAELASQEESSDIVAVPDLGERLYIDLFRRVEAALAECAMTALGHLQRPVPGAWQAHAWVLERRFGYRQSMEIETIADGARDESAAVLEIVRSLAETDATEIREQLDAAGVTVV